MITKMGMDARKHTFLQCTAKFYKVKHSSIHHIRRRRCLMAKVLAAPPKFSGFNFENLFILLARTMLSTHRTQLKV